MTVAVISGRRGILGCEKAGKLAASGIKRCLYRLRIAVVKQRLTVIADGSADEHVDRSFA